MRVSIRRREKHTIRGKLDNIGVMHSSYVIYYSVTPFHFIFKP